VFEELAINIGTYKYGENQNLDAIADRVRSSRINNLSINVKPSTREFDLILTLPELFGNLDVKLVDPE
jgi:hypothetical protein